MALTRRGFLKASGFGLLAASLGTLSACTPQATSGSAVWRGSGAGSTRAGSAPAGNAGSAAVGSPSEVVFVMDAASEPANGFDPLRGWGCGTQVHNPLIQSTLVTVNAEGGFDCDIATGYSTSDDGLTWTFGIRDDALFSDGTPLSATDVAFTINKLASGTTAGGIDLSFVQRAQATGATQVVITLEKPFNALPFVLSVVGIVPKALYKKKSYGTQPIGSGRWLLEEWTPGEQATFTANPTYYGSAPGIERLVVRFMAEGDALAAAQSGQADVVCVQPAYAGQVPSGYSLYDCTSVDCRGVSLPCQQAGQQREVGTATYAAGNEVTCHQELRQAISYVLDRQLMASEVLDGYGTAAYSPCDSASWANADMKVATNHLKARKLLTAAGWAKGDDGVYALEGLRASFALYYPQDDSLQQALAEAFSSQLASFGIEVTPTGAPLSGADDGLYAHQYSDAVLWGCGANSPVLLSDLAYSTSARNYAGLADETVDACIDAALAAESEADSYAQWQQAQDDIGPAGAASWAWLVNPEHLYLVRSALKLPSQKAHAFGQGWALAESAHEWAWQ